VRLDDTICAISSAVGPAARIVLRLSGPAAAQLARGLGADLPGHARAQRAALNLDGLAFPAWIYQFVAPRSYTAQDLIELHIPGNPLLARRLLDRLARDGARPAEPGEFTARAFFNGKLDLAQAEGVAAAIAALTRSQLHAARCLMAGELTRRLAGPMEQLVQLLALVEADIDFSDQDVQVLAMPQAAMRLQAIQDQLDSLVAGSARFEKLSHEPTIVLAGRPNAGKSTLANALAAQARAIVSPQAGTTRDALSVELKLRRGIVRLIDMPGIETPADGDPTPIQIQQQMQRQAQRMIGQADVLILVRDITDTQPSLDLPRTPDLTAISKSDLIPSPGTPGEGQGEGLRHRLNHPSPQPSPGVPGEGARENLSPGVPGEGAREALCVSAHTGQNLEHLRGELDRLAFGIDAPAASLALTSRHLLVIDQARAALDRARARLDRNQLELLAADLREALGALGQVLGAVTPDDILGRIFATFCIGK
jgi:tRNA modification GTPase